MNVREMLFENKDADYKMFHCKLVPNVDDNKIIGVRLPVLRNIAKQAVKNNADFDVYYYEELMIKGLMIGYKKATIDQYIADLKSFVPLIDNWAVCDSCCSTYKFACKYQQEIWEFIQQYLNGNEFEIRFSVVMMLDYFINDNYIDLVIDNLTDIKSGKYYVDMAVAWTLSVAFIKYREKVERVLDNKILSVWVHNKTIQKICESYRVDKETKAKLRELKI